MEMEELDEIGTQDYNYNSSELLFVPTINATTNTNVPVSIPFLPLGLGLIILTIFGLFGNSVSAFVLSGKRLRSSYSVLALGLTIADSIYLMTKLLRYGLASWFVHSSIASHYTKVFIPIFGPYLRPLTFTAHTASTYFTMAIALDRYIALSLPSRARQFCTVKQAFITSLVVYLFSALYNIPRWWEFHTEEYVAYDESLDENVTFYAMQVSPLRENADYKHYYIFWSYFIVMFCLPFVSLSILNVFVWNSIQIIQHSKMSSTQRRDASFAAMLIGVVVVFLLCNLDYLVLDILDHNGVKYDKFWNHLGNFLLTVNSAVNFLIYCVCGQKFREELKKSIMETFPWCGCIKSSASHDISNSGIRTEGYIDMHTIVRR